MVVVYDYFNHANLNNDFYSKESYDLTYGDTPLSSNYNSYADIIDFRYVIENGTSGSGTVGTPYSDNNTNPFLNLFLPSPSRIFKLAVLFSSKFNEE